MKFHNAMLKLYAVTNRQCLNSIPLEQAVASALAGGVTCVQYREKQGLLQDLIGEARSLTELCHRFTVPLIVNDRIDVASLAGADGVHLGQGDATIKEARAQLGKRAIIGQSVHSVEEAQEAQANGADYLGAGALFTTVSKEKTTPLTLQMLRDICSAVTIPVVAIGGISKNNMLHLRATGIAGVAVISALFSADHIEKTAHRLRQMSESISTDIPTKSTL